MDEKLVEKASSIALLISKRLQNKLSPEEAVVLQNWIDEDSNNFMLLEEFQNDERVTAMLEEFKSFNKQASIEKLLQKMRHLLPQHLLIVLCSSFAWYIENPHG